MLFAFFDITEACPILKIFPKRVCPAFLAFTANLRQGLRLFLPDNAGLELYL